jgi:pyruvate/2-oxoglutarate/acetoin dehydrogenase E1 component
MGQRLNRRWPKKMRYDDRVHTMATSPSPTLLAKYGARRVKRMAISEATMTGIAVGSAGCRYRAVVHWGSVTFAFMALPGTAACRRG